MVNPVIIVERAKGQSITGGEFFIGNPASAFHGVYFFGDYNTDSLWAARIVNDSSLERIRIGSLNGVASFNLDRRGRVLATSMDNGTVNVLESVDMVLAPTSVRPSRMPGIKAISLSDLRSHPEAYTVMRLDGRTIPSGAHFSGTVLVRPKGSREPAQLIPWMD